MERLPTASLRRQSVVFDCNAYLDLVETMPWSDMPRHAEETLRSEDRNGHRAYASPTVLLEMIAHLRDTNASRYDTWLRATWLLSTHCSQLDSPGMPIRGIAPLEAQLCRDLFGEMPAYLSETHDQLHRVCIAVRTDYRNYHSVQGLLELVEEIERHVQTAEQGFADEIFRCVVQPMQPGITNWSQLQGNPKISGKVHRFLKSGEHLKLFGAAQVLKCADLLGRDIAPDVVGAMALQCSARFRVAAELYGQELARIILQGANFDKPSRRNTFWDVEIATVVGDGITIDGLPVLLVTGDRKIAEAASRVGCGGNVVNLQQYIKSLAGPNLT
jgi:hypothetical protein